MKKLLIVGLAVAFGFQSVNAQETAVIDTSWKTGGITALNFNQVSLSNWAAGGENSLSGAAFLSLFANHAKQRFAWDNVLDLGYGLIKPGSDDIRKNEDKIELNSKAGFQTSETSKWYYSALANFKSQFAEGFVYGEDANGAEIKTLNSNLFAPAYILGALGMDYKPQDNFSVFISPVTAKFTIVTEDELNAIGAFGVDPGETSRSEFGGYLNARFTQDIMENINFLTKLDLFSNYDQNPQNIDVNWELLLAAKVNEYISASLGAQIIYDHDITVPKNESGTKLGKGTQVKQVFGIGISYALK